MCVVCCPFLKPPFSCGARSNIHRERYGQRPIEPQFGEMRSDDSWAYQGEPEQKGTGFHKITLSSSSLWFVHNSISLPYRCLARIMTSRMRLHSKIRSQPVCHAHPGIHTMNTSILWILGRDTAANFIGIYSDVHRICSWWEGNVAESSWWWSPLSLPLLLLSLSCYLYSLFGLKIYLYTSVLICGGSFSHLSVPISLFLCRAVILSMFAQSYLSSLSYHDTDDDVDVDVRYVRSWTWRCGGPICRHSFDAGQIYAALETPHIHVCIYMHVLCIISVYINFHNIMVGKALVKFL